MARVFTARADSGMSEMAFFLLRVVCRSHSSAHKRRSNDFSVLCANDFSEVSIRTKQSFFESNYPFTDSARIRIESKPIQQMV